MPRIRPRISLLTALLLMTIVGLAIVVVQLWREVGPLREEVRRLRTEVGDLTIDDPNKAYAITVPTFETDTWKWRIYLPPKRNYVLHERSGTFPPAARRIGAAGFKACMSAGVGSASESTGFRGEFVLEARPEKEGDRWQINTRAVKRGSDSSSSSGGSTGIWQPTEDWLSNRRARIILSAVSSSQKAFAPGEPILLLHVTRPVITDLSGGGHSSHPPTDSADGFALWIEQQPPSTP